MKQVAQTVAEVTPQLAGLDTVAQLTYINSVFTNKAVFSTSFGLEDQVITHLIAENNLPIQLATLDTGRLFPETYLAWNRTREKYGKAIHVFAPQADSVGELLSQKGPFSFYESVENRKECCRIRKVEPLKRMLIGMECWITGIRAEQSDNRTNMPQFEWDDANQVFKFHPLLDWSLDKVKHFIETHNIPYNSLHDRNFPSIGCAPCTRAVAPGQDVRAGRWWWESNNQKECGLHEHPITK